MGATVTTGKRAAAFKAPSGQNFYVLFEETYEKNCTPHTPHWNCILFGDLIAAMERIFRHASACEGGMLQGRGGSITPRTSPQNDLGKYPVLGAVIYGWIRITGKVQARKSCFLPVIGLGGLYLEGNCLSL